MYRHCIYCSAKLGTNESVEAFPVGRTLAFDTANGRLWAICPGCARWNLAPIEERWEAVEEAEKRYADARLRVQRENIGLAKLRDGTRLVRIGTALPDELAAWRYGEEFHLRQRRARWAHKASLVMAAAQVGATVAFIAGVFPMAAVLVPGLWAPTRMAARYLSRVGGDGRLQALPREAAPGLPPMVLRRRDLNGAHVSLADDGSIRLDLPEVFLPGGLNARTTSVRIEGEPAARLLAKGLVIVNAKGARAKEIEAARALLLTAGSPAALLGTALRRGPFRQLRARVEAAQRAGVVFGPDTDVRGYAAAGEPLDLGIRLGHLRESVFQVRRNAAGLIPDLSSAEALALEMALHEESERRALHGELALLQSAWREAEEIAGIADTLALPGDRG